MGLELRELARGLGRGAEGGSCSEEGAEGWGAGGHCGMNELGLRAVAQLTDKAVRECCGRGKKGGEKESNGSSGTVSELTELDRLGPPVPMSWRWPCAICTACQNMDYSDRQ